MMKLDKKILITGGGSGGHVSAALGLISTLEKRYDNLYKKLLYVGGNLPMSGETNKKSYEERRISKLKKIKYVSIRAGKLQRSFDKRMLKLLLGTVGGFIDAYKILKNFKPDIVFSTGGYVTLPICVIAGLMKIPVYIHEQTAAIGLTNKVASRFAKKIFVTFEESFNYLPKNKTIHTGNLVRNSLFTKKPQGIVVDKLKEMKDSSTLPIIYISGGGLGSHKLNITVREMLPYALQKYQIILQTGDNQIYRDFDVIYKDYLKLEPKLKQRFFPTKWVEETEMGYLLKNIDMFVGRAGANTVYEMGLFRKPSIFIPIPWVTNNEQYKNAKVLADLGLAKILPEGELTSERLDLDIQKFIKQLPLTNINDKKLSELFTIDAGEKIIKELEELR